MGGSPTFDTGVDNLERFIAALAQATAEVQQSTDELQSHRDTLEGLEDSVEEAVGGYADEVERLRDELDDDHDEAKEEVEGVARSAQDVAEEELASAEDSLERGESAFGERLSEGRADWDRDFHQLADGGFRSLDSELETVKQDTQASQQETEGAFDSLEGALQTLHGEADTLQTETTSRMDALQNALEDTARAELESAATECVNGFSGLKDELETECTTIGQEEQHFYPPWLEEQKAHGQEIQDSFKTLMDDAAEELGTLGRERVEGPVDEALRENLDPLGEELDEFESETSSEERTMTELEPLVEELEIAKHMVGEIDQVLQSMGE